VYESALAYLEDHVLSTSKYRDFVADVETVLTEQLEIESEGFELRLSPPDPSHFFKNLLFTVREETGQPLLPISYMGTGFQSLFVVALLRALVDSASGGRIFVIEEPESFLHEHYQEYFYQVLCRLSQNNQVIITTHSKKFVDPFEPRSILRLVKTAGEGTIGIAPQTKLGTPTELDGNDLRRPDDFPKYLRTLEPNLGNVVFASKVVIVEGPHDLLAYTTLIATAVPLGLRNIAVVAAWGKDPIVSLVDLCNLLQIDCYVVHDSDLPHGGDPSAYTPAQKAQQTKNATIAGRMNDGHIHQNVPNLEAVLGIPLAEKSAAAVFSRVETVTLAEAARDIPALIPKSLLEFLGLAVE
jgi:putative ATP-dependent endonuclease of OLD family